LGIASKGIDHNYRSIDFMQLIFLIVISLLLNLGFWKIAYSAVDQILNDNFFQNPAELDLVDRAQLLVGNAFILPKLRFTGITPLGYGSVKSKVEDSIPYLLSAYRLTERLVIGMNMTPSAYGYIDWQPHDSIVSQASTTTRLLYYRFGAQSSYKFTDRLVLGIGMNLEYNKLCELNFVVPNMGNEINRIKGLNYTGDVGLFYKINSRSNLTMTIYTGVNTYGHGTSSTEAITVPNFSLNIIQAPVGSIGLQHWLTDKWFTEIKVYWSGWSIEKNVNFRNTTTGNSISPANWRDTWSFQVNTRYKITNSTALLGSVLYETNAAPISTNAIGYPLSGYSSISVGLDLTLSRNLSVQLGYSYGELIPYAKINSGGRRGIISANFQAAVLEFVYKL
jgi:long-subunit fatty acid transport protein